MQEIQSTKFNKLEYQRQYRLANIKKIKETELQWRLANKEKLKEYMRQYSLTNKEKLTEQYRRYYSANKEKQKAARHQYIYDLLKTDPTYKLALRCRQRVRSALKAQKAHKTSKTTELLGCSIAELKAHLESRFQPNMSWDNMGKWHIDHIQPCSSFNLADPEELKKCFHYTNLQPLWAKDNLAKSKSLNYCND